MKNNDINVNEGMIKRLLLSATPSLITAFVLMVSTALLNSNLSIINISDSVLINGTYQTIISVENNREKTLKDITIFIDEDFKVSEDEHIFKSNDNILINYIPPKSIYSFLVSSNNPLNKTNLNFDLAGFKQIQFAIHSILFLKMSIIVIIIFLIIEVLPMIYQEKKFRKSILENKKRKQELIDLKKRLKDLETRSNKLDHKYLKVKLLFSKKIEMYRKELEFWKATISNYICNSGYEGDKSKINLFFEFVTKTLETNATNEKFKKYIEDIENIQQELMLKDDDFKDDINFY